MASVSPAAKAFPTAESDGMHANASFVGAKMVMLQAAATVFVTSGIF